MNPFKTLALATYLAFKEVVRNRGRFFLVSLVIALITLLVLFIAALGEGLGNSNRQYLANLDADLLVYSEKADLVIPSSRVERTDSRILSRVDGVQNAGIIATSNTSILLNDGSVLKVSLIGVEPGHPGSPAIIEGRELGSELAKEVVIDRNVALRSNIKVGDRITIRSTQGTDDKLFDLKVVGMSDGQLYAFQPSIFVTFSNWDDVRTKSDTELGKTSTTVNVIAVKLKNPSQAEIVKANIANRIDQIQIADIPTAIQNVPGYSAQQTTVQTQAIFTLLIGVLVIGGFFQIQILQKVPQIGVLKAIGAANPMVGISAIIQIVIVTVIGVGIGGGLAYVFSLFFPPTVPIVFNGTSSAIAVVALLLIGPLGGLVSIIYAVRIEPLKALRLS
jgi:putative ABC transport system permease protein